MLSTEKVIDLAVEAIEEKKGQNIVKIDLSKQAAFTDYFVICSGANAPQIRAICDNVEEKLEAEGAFAKRIEGKDDAHWVLMDYGDFLLHIFNQEDRDYYKLERLWQGEEKTKMQEEE